MITPLMHILSCLDKDYNITAPASILYLNAKDRQLISSEAKRLCKFVLDENKIFMTDSDFGDHVVSEYQQCVNDMITVDRYTALLLTRIRQCAEAYLKGVEVAEEAIEDDDLSADITILRLEGNPNYMYAFVFNTMRLPGIGYDAKIAKIAEVLETINQHAMTAQTTAVLDKNASRLEAQSDLAYWKGLLTADFVRIYGGKVPRFDMDTLENIKKELRSLGLYGFVNPLAMYTEFVSSRVSRKTSANISDSVIAFLTNIVLSGGGTVSEVNN